MLETLREEVLEANLALQTHGLVTLTWGNASGIDRAHGLIVIKPSGVSYETLGSADMVVVDLGGNVVAGGRPSTDTPTHLALYRAFEQIGGVVHTHSTWATAWAQAQREIPLLGTTHADLCPHPIPLTRALSAEEVSLTTRAPPARCWWRRSRRGVRSSSHVRWFAGMRRSAGARTRARPWTAR